MTSNTLLISALASLATSGLYLYIGFVLRKRRVSPESRLANNMFVLWWMALGGIGVLGATMTLVYTTGVLQVWFYQAYTSFLLIVLFAALWGLQYYLVYLYTGSPRSFAPLGVFYSILLFATLGLMAYIGAPESLTDNGWQLRTSPRVELTQAFSLLFIVVLIGPQMVAAVAYARLYRKARDRTQRYRIALVTTAILVWFGSSLVATALEASQSIAWQLASRLISVLGATTILFAYKPPGFIQRKYGIAPVELQTPTQVAREPTL